MKKRTALISILSAMLLTFNVSAAEITKVMVTDFDNSVITVSGEAKEDSVTVTMLPKDTVLSDGEYTHDSNVSIQMAETKDGKFSVSFKFTGDAAWYDIYASNSEKPFAYEVVEKSNVLDFADKLGDAVYQEDELYEKLKYFCPAMGIDLSFAENISDMFYVVRAVLRDSAKIKQNGVSAVEEIIYKTKSELEFLDKLSEAQSVTVTNNLLGEYASSAGINISSYSALTDYGKNYVCMLFMGKTYSDIDVFRTEFNQAVASAPLSGPQNNQGSQGGFSGGGGGGSFAGSVSLPANAPSQTKSEDATAIFEKFTDITSVSWAWDAIVYLSDKNIINGTGNNEFLPNDKITREQFAKIIAVAFDCYDSTLSADFSDSIDSWAASYIESVRKHGYMNGIDSQNFGIGMNITREDICTVIYRAAVKNGFEFKKSKTDFTDFGDVSDYAKEAVSSLAGEGILQGTGDGSFKPQNSATRAEAAKIIYSVMTSLLNK